MFYCADNCNSLQTGSLKCQSLKRQLPDDADVFGSLFTPAKKKAVSEAQRARMFLLPPRKVIAAGMWAHEWMMDGRDVRVETVQDTKCQWVFPVGRFVIRYGASESACLFEVEILSEQHKSSDGRVVVKASKLKSSSNASTSQQHGTTTSKEKNKQQSRKENQNTSTTDGCIGSIEDVAIWLRIESALGSQSAKLEQERDRLFKKRSQNGAYDKYNFGHITEWFPRYCGKLNRGTTDLFSVLAESVSEQAPPELEEVYPITDLLTDTMELGNAIEAQRRGNWMIDLDQM